MKKPRVFICVDRGMIWEAAGDIEVTLIIKNIDKGWIRHLQVPQNVYVVNKEEELVNIMEAEGFVPADQLAEQKRQLRKQKSKLVQIPKKLILDKKGKK